MNKQIKWHLFVSSFLVCWILYFSLPALFQDNSIPFYDIVDNQPDKFLAMIFLNLLIAFVVTFSIDMFYRSIKRLRWFKPRIGQVMIKRGYITENDLNQALQEQRLKIGEILLNSETITEEELMDALRLQQDNSGKKLGEIIQERGYARHEDIQWALHRKRRRLGEILVDRGIITTYELNIVLGRMWYARYKGL